MISKPLQDRLNEQINFELFSAYLYLSMSAHFEAQNLPGFANWMRVQYQEETGHAMKLYKYVFDRSGVVTLKAIAQPATKFKTPVEIFKQVLEHEQKVTSLINKLYELSVKEKDYAAQSFLQWFINEQVEEEKNASEIVESMKRIEAHETAVLQLDHQLGKRGKE
jgi:ferritin